MTKRSGRTAAGALGSLASAIIAFAAGAADLRPHSALYELDLAAARGGSEIAALSGSMALEWADACDGWTVSQNIRMAITNRDGASFENVIRFSSFENRAGDRFRFSMKWTAAGETVEEFAGRAENGPDGGDVALTAPEGESLRLPAGTLFPTAHLFRLVEAAAGGERRFARAVFAGTGRDSLHEVVAFFGREIAAGERPLPRAADRPALRELAGLRSWPVSLAYYPVDSREPRPDFEVAYRLLENGVAGDLSLDYGDFAMNAALVEVEFPPPPAC